MVQKAQDPRVVRCEIGTEKIEFLVDSGAIVNTITVESWYTLKRNCKTVIQDVVMIPEETLKSYANEKPIEVLCSFMSFVGVEGRLRKIVLAKFYVVKGI